MAGYLFFSYLYHISTGLDYKTLNLLLENSMDLKVPV